MPIDPLPANANRPVNFAQHYPLLAALESENSAAVTLALAQNATLPPRDEDGWTPVMWAAVNGHTGLFDQMVSRFDPEGKTVNDKNHEGATALMIAAEAWDDLVMKRLLELGADPNALHPCGSTALLLFLEETPEDANVDLIEAFVEAGVDLNATNAEGRNALIYAADKFARETLSYVARHMSPHHINDVDEAGCSALFYAAQRDLEMVQFLVEHGALADVTAADGTTAEQRALAWGLPDVATFLQQTANQQRQTQAILRAGASA